MAENDDGGDDDGFPTESELQDIQATLDGLDTDKSGDDAASQRDQLATMVSSFFKKKETPYRGPPLQRLTTLTAALTGRHLHFPGPFPASTGCGTAGNYSHPPAAIAPFQVHD